jgi:hypothetical protein
VYTTLPNTHTPLDVYNTRNIHSPIDVYNDPLSYRCIQQSNIHFPRHKLHTSLSSILVYRLEEIEKKASLRRPLNATRPTKRFCLSPPAPVHLSPPSRTLQLSLTLSLQMTYPPVTSWTTPSLHPTTPPRLYQPTHLSIFLENGRHILGCISLIAVTHEYRLRRGGKRSGRVRGGRGAEEAGMEERRGTAIQRRASQRAGMWLLVWHRAHAACR